MDKDNFFTGIAIAILTFFSPVYGLLGLMTAACLVDHFFGVWRVLKMREDFKMWVGISKTFSKVVAYSILIIVAYVFDRNLINELSIKVLSASDIVAKIFTLGLCLNEWRSINRNFKTVKGVSIWERLMEGLTGVRKVVERVADIKGKLPILIVLLLVSCSPITRHSNLVNKYPYLHRMDSVDKVIGFEVNIAGSKMDTVFNDLIRRDTIRMVKDRLSVKYFRHGDTVYLSGECDPVTELVRVKVKVPVTYYPDKLKWWQYPVVIFGFSVASLSVGWFLLKRK